MFDLLFGELPGYVEIRLLPSGEQIFCSLEPEQRSTLVPLVNHLTVLESGQECFFEIATRRTSGDGSRANCQYLPSLFADLDFKDIPSANARDRLAKCPCRPSIIVRSGFGLHLYWLLREAVDLTTEAEQVKKTLRRLTAHLGGDLQAAEPARILRVPGSLNHKYSPARRVTIESCDSTLRYNPSDFDWLPELDLHGPNTSASPGSLTKQIEEGRRNGELYKLGRSLKARGLSTAWIAGTLHHLNDTICVPPLPFGEVEGLARKVVEQPDRPDLRRNQRRSEDTHTSTLRTVKLTPASSIEPRQVRWLWSGRLALGALGLLGALVHNSIEG